MNNPSKKGVTFISISVSLSISTISIYMSIYLSIVVAIFDVHLTNRKKLYMQIMFPITIHVNKMNE